MAAQSTDFHLDPRLQADCEFVVDLPISRLLLMNNASLPWFILVPRIDGATELTALAMPIQQQVLAEVNQVAELLEQLYQPQKLNIGALGNVVSQLHIHVIGRFHSDPAWPNPVWGNLPNRPYTASEVTPLLDKIRQRLG
ncbi:MAG TPA: HIT family protein [Oceanospirillaceae bacterium]|nr:HIT family protein [Oceanospirillaceae bacterium]